MSLPAVAHDHGCEVVAPTLLNGPLLPFCSDSAVAQSSSVGVRAMSSWNAPVAELKPPTRTSSVVACAVVTTRRERALRVEQPGSSSLQPSEVSPPQPPVNTCSTVSNVVAALQVENVTSDPAGAA